MNIRNENVFIIGLDLGTSAIKGIIMDSRGTIAAQAEKKTRFIHPAEGLVEIAPDEHYQHVCEVLKKLASSVNGPVKAVAMAAASGNTLLTDENGIPLTNIINWMDIRAVRKRPAVLDQFTVNEVRNISGWPCIDMFPIGHLAWLAENKPELFKSAKRQCMNTDWLLFRLTGKWAIDYSTGATFHLQEQISKTYYEPFLNRLGLTKEKLSPLVPPGRNIGRLTSHALRDTGLSADTEIITGSFDHPSAARGEGILEPGQLLLSCGTSWVGFFPEFDRSKIIGAELLCDTFLTESGGPWGAIFSIPCIGRNIDWYIDNLIAPDEKEKYTLFNNLAAEANPGAEGLKIDLLKTPENINADKKNISRAVMENAALLLNGKLESMKKIGMNFRDATMVGGPSKSHLWPSIVQEITGLNIKIGSSHSGAKGAAILAGIGCGIYKNEKDALNTWNL